MMPIQCIGKFSGFGAYSSRPRGSAIIWQACKDYFRDPLIIQQLKMYHRSSPGLSSLYASVCEYDRPYARRPTDTLLDGILEEATIRFAPPNQLPLLHINEMQRSEFPMNTSPCIPYTMRTNPATGKNYRTKDEAWDVAKRDARQLAHMIKEGHKVHLPPSMVFARGKICTRDKIKTRAIWGKSFSVLIMQAIFFRNLWNFYLQGTTPMAYRYKTFHRGSKYLRDDLILSGYNPVTGGTLLSLDFSKYDTSIPPWLIFTVYDMFRKYLKFDEYMYYGTPDPYKTERLYRRLARECVDTTFRMPDGYQFQKHGGVDSGSFDFQLIECVCTWIMIQYALRKLGYQPTFCSVMGDDSITLIPGHKRIDLDAVARLIQDTFGVEMNKDKSTVNQYLRETKFLGRYCHNGLPYRDTADVIMAALYPSRTDRDIMDTAERIVALYYDNANVNHSARVFLKHCWATIATILTRSGWTATTHSWENRWTKKFTMWGLKAPPELRLPDDITLNHLVLSEHVN